MSERAGSVVATTSMAARPPPTTHAAHELESFGLQQLLSGAVTPAASSAPSVTSGGGGGSGSTVAKLSELRSKLERSLRTAEEGLNAELQLLDWRATVGVHTAQHSTQSKVNNSRCFHRAVKGGTEP